MVRVIRKQMVKRSLDLLKEIASRPADDKGRSDFDTFYEAFGRCASLANLVLINVKQQR